MSEEHWKLSIFFSWGKEGSGGGKDERQGVVSDERRQGGRSATVAGLFNFEKKLRHILPRGMGVKEKNRWFIGGSEGGMEESFSVCLINFLMK